MIKYLLLSLLLATPAVAKLQEFEAQPIYNPNVFYCYDHDIQIGQECHLDIKDFDKDNLPLIPLPDVDILYPLTKDLYPLTDGPLKKALTICHANAEELTSDNKGRWEIKYHYPEDWKDCLKITTMVNQELSKIGKEVEKELKIRSEPNRKFVIGVADGDIK